MRKNRFSLLILCLLICSLLTGCIGIKATTEIKSDGSGTMGVFVGYTEEAINSVKEMGGTTSEEFKDSIVHNGVTYLGVKEKEEFSNLDELNELLVSEDGSNVDSGSWKVYTLNGDIYIEVKTSSSTGNSVEFATASGANVDELSAEDLQKLADTMFINFEFKLPKNVIQLSGPKEGVTINGNLLSLDLMKMSAEFETTYTFTTAEGVCEPPVTTPEVPVVKGFTDVSQDSWYYNAVTALAEGGLVEGVGNNMFNPYGNMTYAAFCQVLARAKFLPTGTEDGYWASKAIKSCIDAGYIFSIGEVNAKNYDVQINREVAIYAIMKARQTELFLANKKVSPSDIPDYNDISPEYADTIVNAYKYEITSGVDAKGTFMPKSFLSRAELCQLFYNLKWTNPLQNTNV